ncbi:MAG TPA: ATP-binding protein [Mycobacteriales bacterium]|nr:ATP-binding protein [Mycobacteriales bacterium]
MSGLRGRLAWRARLSAYLGGEPLFPLVVLFGLTWADQVDTRTFEVLGPEIADSFGVGEGVLGTIGILTVLIAPLVGLPLSYLADRWKRVPLAIGGAAVWAVASVLTGFAPVLAVLIALRVIATSGEIVNTPVHGSLMADSYTTSTRMKAFGIYSVGQTVGAALGAILAGALGEAFGWRVPFVVLALPTFAVLLLATRLPEPERGRFEPGETPKAPPFRDTVRELWRLRSLRYQWIGTAFAAAALLPLRLIVPFFLRDEFSVSPSGRGTIIGVGTAMTLFAALSGTAFVQRNLNVTPSRGLRVLSWLGIATGVAMVLLSVAPSLLVVVPLIWVIVCLFAILSPALLAVTAIIAAPEMRSTAFALQGLVALSGAPLALVGVALGDKHPRMALFYLGTLFLIGIRSFFTAARYIDADVARLDPARRSRATGGTDGGKVVLLQTQDVTVSYSGVQVLFGVDLEVHEGEIVALLGTNGAGKSTILNAISGVVEPDGGNVWFQGEAITGEAPERTVARGIVQVPGGRGVFPRLTVEENLAMGGFLLRRDKELLARRTEEVLELFPRLRERLKQPAGVLSGGERQMLTLGQSFLLRPKVMLIDELSLGLAPTVVQELLVALRRINAEGTAVVLVEQSVNVALTLADRAYFMEKGEVRFSGPTSQLLERSDLLRSVFLEGAGAR